MSWPDSVEAIVINRVSLSRLSRKHLLTARFSHSDPEPPSAAPGFCNALTPSTGTSRGTEFMEFRSVTALLLRHSPTTPAALIGAAHFSISLSTNFRRYSGERRSDA